MTNSSPEKELEQIKLLLLGFQSNIMQFSVMLLQNFVQALDMQTKKLYEQNQQAQLNSDINSPKNSPKP